MEFTSLWDGAGDAAETAQADRSLAMAKAASQGFWPFLAGAQTEQEYVHREALAENKIILAAEAGGITTVALAQALKVDWDMVAEARAAAVPEPPPFPSSDEPVRVRRLAIVHVAGFPPTDGDDDQQADMDGDGQDDDDPSAVAPSPGYYVLDEDSNLDIGGPYASKADASDAIDAGVFDADPEGVTVQKGTVAENGGAPDDQQDPDADPAADPDADPDAPPPADDDKGGNPFAKGAAAEYRRECPRCGHEWESRTSNVERCPECGAPLDKQGSLKTANPYTDDNPYTKDEPSKMDDDKNSSTPDLAGGLPQDGVPGEPGGGSLTTKPRQMPSGDSNTPQDMGGDATGTNIPPGL